jgi:hypothetical protein
MVGVPIEMHQCPFLPWCERFWQHGDFVYWGIYRGSVGSRAEKPNADTGAAESDHAGNLGGVES